MDGFRCEAWLTVLSIRRVGLSPVQVPPAMPAGEMLLLVDLIELARAIDRHWLPHVRHIARRVRHAGLFLELPLTRVLWSDVETVHFSRGSTVISIRPFRSDRRGSRSRDSRIAIDIDNHFHNNSSRCSSFSYFVRFLSQFFEDPFGVGEKNFSNRDAFRRN